MGGRDADAARRNRPGGDRVNLDDERFWTNLECSCASAFSWTLDVIYDTLDLPRYLAYLEWWAENPPLFLIPRAFASGAGTGTGAADSQSRPSPDDDERGAGAFLNKFVAAGGQARHVPKDYFDRVVAELDSNKEAFLEERLRRTAEDRRYVN